MQVGNTISTPALAQMLQDQMNGVTSGQNAFAEGGFGMVLQQMIASGQGGAFDAVFAQMQEDSEDQAMDMAVQMMAELFGIGNNPAFLDQLLSQQTDAMDALNASMNPGDMQQLLVSMLQEGKTETVSTTNSALNELFAQAMDDQQQGSSATSEVLGSKYLSENMDADPLLEQKNFLLSVAEAKKQMMEGENPNSKKQDTVVLDIDQLQQQVNAGRYDTTASKIESANMLDAKDMMEQIQTGLKQNLGQGKNEFEISLKPEGLGKNTVKLVESGDKMTLSLMTSNSQVAKLLNGNLAELREAMRPYQVEVREAVSQSAASAQEGNIFGQNYADQQRQQFEQQSRHTSDPQYYVDGLDNYEEDMLDPLQNLTHIRYV